MRCGFKIDWKATIKDSYTLQGDIYDKIKNSTNISYSRKKRHAPLYSAFLQDEVTLIHNRLKLILGTKYENNDYTGSEIMPNGKL